MNENALTNSKTDIDQKPLVKHWWLSLLICLIGGILLGGIYFLFEMKNFPLVKNGEPTLSLNPSTLIWLSSCTVILIGLSTFFMLTTSGMINRPKKEIIENLISLSATCLLILLYPLFFYLCSLKIVGVVILGLAILSASYTTYRYYNACLLAGTIMGLITLWLNYLFIISFGFLLL